MTQLSKKIMIDNILASIKRLGVNPDEVFHVDCFGIPDGVVPSAWLPQQDGITLSHIYRETYGPIFPV